MEEFNSSAIYFRCTIWLNEIEQFIYLYVGALKLNTTNT